MDVFKLRDAANHILGTFLVVRHEDEKAHGDYRTERVILQMYNQMAEAMKTGRPYQTWLDPRPADPRVAHAAKEEVK